MPAVSWAMMRTTAPGKEMAPCTNMATDTLGFTWEPPEMMSHCSNVVDVCGDGCGG